MDRESKYPVIAILTSLTMHCVVVIAYCLLSDHSLPLNKHQQAPKFSVILSYLSEEGGTLPLASAVKQKAVISETFMSYDDTKDNENPPSPPLEKGGWGDFQVKNRKEGPARPLTCKKAKQMMFFRKRWRRFPLRAQVM